MNEFKRKIFIHFYELDENISMVSWDGKNARGREVGSGIYFYQLKADSRVIQTKKCLFYK